MNFANLLLTEENKNFLRNLGEFSEDLDSSRGRGLNNTSKLFIH